MTVFHQHFLNPVVGLETEDATATGFMFIHFGDPPVVGRRAPVFLVTAAHVFETDSEKVVVTCNASGNETPDIFELPLIEDASDQRMWVRHPDPDIDIAVLPVLFMDMIPNPNLLVFQTGINVATIQQVHEDSIAEGDGIFLLGFPLGIGSTISLGDQNTAVVRGGTIARIQEAFAGKSKYYLLDSSIYPGDSGSPVINKIERAYVKDSKPITESKLIGISVARLADEDTQETRLAVVHPCDYIIETIEHCTAQKANGF